MPRPLPDDQGKPLGRSLAKKAPKTRHIYPAEATVLAMAAYRRMRDERDRAIEAFRLATEFVEARAVWAGDACGCCRIVAASLRGRFQSVSKVGP